MQFLLRVVMGTLFFLPLIANPFIVKAPERLQLTIEEYVDVQKQLEALSLSEVVKELHPLAEGFATVEIFEARCGHATKLKIIDLEKGLIPIRKLEKIGKGGDRCIVCYAPYAADEWGKKVENFDLYIKTILEALKSTEFNGYFYYMLGGFPNPTGKELKYAAVPYSAKIFMMLEAKNLGFNHVLWIDPTLLPLRSPSSFFFWIEKKECFLRGWPAPGNVSAFIFPTTRAFLHQLTGSDVAAVNYIDSRIFGLKMDTDLANKFIGDYYAMVEHGTPFLSCFPDDFVISAILGQLEFSAWRVQNLGVFLCTFEQLPPTPESVEQMKKEGVFFYQRPY